MNVAEIVKLLQTVDSLTGKLEQAFEKIKGEVEKETNAKKRKKLVAAAERRDASAVRSLLFD